MSAGAQAVPLWPAPMRALLGAVLHLLRPRDGGRRLLRYAALGLALAGAVWGPTAAYLGLATDAYVSKWSLVLPGAGAGAQVNLEAVGQASTLSNSPFGNHSVDPKANYRAIATSAPVLAAAARRLGIDEREFSKPRIKLVDQTAVMEFAVTGRNPEQARERAHALHDAFVTHLERLRHDEMTRREVGTRRTLDIFERKLRLAEQALLGYQSEAGIVSVEQFRDLARNGEALRKQRAETLAEERRARGELERLAALLGMPASSAAKVFVLQADEVFRRHLAALGEAEANLNEYRSKWGSNHPKIVKERARRREAHRALTERARSLVGEFPSLAASIANAAADSGQSALLRQLIEAQARAAGLEAKGVSLEKAIAEFGVRLQALTGRAAALESLERRHQVATAVFTSALARVDLGRSDMYVSYPLVQLLTEPTLPEAGLAPNKRYALIGAVAGSLFFLTGLVLLWLRRPFIQKTLKSV